MIPRRELAGRILLVVAAVGAAATVTATVVGVGFLTELDRSLEASLGVSTRAVEALVATVDLAEETLGMVERSLGRTVRTTRDVGGALGDAGDVLDATADLTEDQLASSLQEVGDALPALIQVAAVIDRTLSALDRVPFGPDYDPAEPFDDSLRAVQVEIADLPETLREQADLLRESRRSMRTVGTGIDQIANDLDGLHRSLSAAREVLAGYAVTAAEARDLLSERRAGLGARLDVGRGLVVVLGAAFTLGQVVPAGAGWFLRDPERVASLLRGE